MRRIYPIALRGLTAALAIPAAASATLAEIGASAPPTSRPCRAAPRAGVWRSAARPHPGEGGHDPQTDERAARRLDRGVDDHAGKPRPRRSRSSPPTRAVPPKQRSRCGRGAETPPHLQADRAGADGELQPYFGKTVQFPLETRIPVKKGEIVALL